MTTLLSLDRFEGKDKSIAVLVTEDGASINIPKALLPPSVKAGDVLRLSLERDAEATMALRAETRKVQKDLKATDPGGDIKL